MILLFIHSIPPSAMRFFRNSFSASPAVQIRPGPLGSLAELRKYRRKSPVFFLKTWRCHQQCHSAPADFSSDDGFLDFR